MLPEMYPHFVLYLEYHDKILEKSILIVCLSWITGIGIKIIVNVV